MFFSLVYVIFVQYSKRAQRTFKIVQISRSHRHGGIIILTSTLVTSPETSTCEILSDVLRKLQADFVYDNGAVEVSLLHSGGETLI